jgi:HSP20 family protein
MRSYRSPLPTITAAAGLRREIDRLFDESLSALGTMATGAANGQPVAPVAADAREDATSIVLELAVPGVTPDSIEVVTQNGVLTVRGAFPSREMAEGETTLLRERPVGTFTRRFRLPKGIDPEQVSASHALGVLTIRIAKPEPARPRRITVQSN